MSKIKSIDGTIIDIDDNERTRCEVYTRCMGYFRPVDFFNTGKKGEFKERVYFSEGNGRAAATHDPELLK